MRGSLDVLIIMDNEAFSHVQFMNVDIQSGHEHACHAYLAVEVEFLISGG